MGNGPSSSSRWTWSGARRRVREVHPTGASFSRTFDGLDRVTRVTRDSDGLALARYGYVGPRLLAADYGNGTGIDMANDAGSGTLTGAGAGYDALGRAVDWTWDHASTSNPIAGWTQSFDPTHRRTSVTESHLGNRVVSMAYDSLGRMTSYAPFGAAPSSFEFDGADKTIGLVDEGIDLAPLVNPTGLLQTLSLGGQMRDYASDGTLTARGDGQDLAFDARGRLVTATDSGGLAAWQYLFDAEGRRMAKIDLGLGQASTRTSYSGNWEVTNESDFQGTPLREWVRAAGIDEHLVLIDYTQPGPDSKLYWYHSSDMGHVGALTDEQGSVVELVRYGALGEAQILAPDGVTERTSSVIGNPYLFQGLWWDTETSSYHNRHRQYDPESGEYLSPDPAGLWRHGQGNGYSAFGSDPWNRRDPWGLSVGGDPLQDLIDSLSASKASAPDELLASLSWNGTPEGMSPSPCYTCHQPMRGLGSGMPTLDDLQNFLDFTSIGMDVTGVGVAVSWIPDVLNGGISAARGDVVGAVLSVLAALPFVGNAANAARIKRTMGVCGEGLEAAGKRGSKAFSKEKGALVDMAKGDKKTGMTRGDMDAYKDLNKELPDPFPERQVHGPERHPSRTPDSSPGPGQEWHGHVGPVNHIPVKD